MPLLAFPVGKPTRLFGDSAVRLAGASAVLLGWRPGEFWAATPEELATVLTALAGESEAPPDVAVLDRLMEQFPDERR